MGRGIGLLIFDVGRFNMDMLQATGIGGVPSSGTQLSGVELVGTQFVASADKVSTAHGYIMAAVVLICAPVLMLHLLSKARLVWVSCASFVTVLLLGYAMGIWDSFNYNRVGGLLVVKVLRMLMK